MRYSILLLPLPFLLLPGLPASGEEVPNNESTQTATPTSSEEELSREAIVEEECD